MVKAEAGILESDGAELAGGAGRGRRGGGRPGHRRLGRRPPPAAGRRRRRPPRGRRADHRRPRGGVRRLAALPHGLAATRPLVLALEDLHRADDALLDFVEGLVDPDAGPAPVSSWPPPGPSCWSAGPAGAPAGPSASSLDDPDTTGLLATLLAHHGLPAEVDPALLGRVGGNPLFAEEYVRMLRDRGGRTPRPTRRPVHRGYAQAPEPLPTGVNAIIAARLDALDAPTRRCSTTRPCSARSAGWARWPRSPAATCPTWRPAWPAWRRASSSRAPASRVAGEVEYAFRHTLVRDVAYGQVLRAERADKHRRAAAWIEGWPPTGPRAGRAARLPLPGRPVVRPGRRADRRAWPAAPRPPCATPATGPRPSAAGTPPASMPRRWS